MRMCKSMWLLDLQLGNNNLALGGKSIVPDHEDLEVNIVGWSNKFPILELH